MGIKRVGHGMAKLAVDRAYRITLQTERSVPQVAVWSPATFHECRRSQKSGVWDFDSKPSAVTERRNGASRVGNIADGVLIELVVPAAVVTLAVDQGFASATDYGEGNPFRSQADVRRHEESHGERMVCSHAGSAEIEEHTLFIASPEQEPHGMINRSAPLFSIDSPAAF
jgi:hypothetical protein